MEEYNYTTLRSSVKIVWLTKKFIWEENDERINLSMSHIGTHTANEYLDAVIFHGSELNTEKKEFSSYSLGSSD